MTDQQPNAPQQAPQWYGHAMFAMALIVGLLLIYMAAQCSAGTSKSAGSSAEVDAPQASEARVERYRTDVGVLIADAGEELDAMGTAATSGDTTDASQYWESMTRLQDIRNRFFDLVPPSGYGEFHATMQAALDEYTNAAESMAIAIENGDSERLLKASKQLDAGTVAFSGAVTLFSAASQ